MHGIETVIPSIRIILFILSKTVYLGREATRCR